MSVYLDESKDWRFIVTDRTSETITMLDTIASERNLQFTLNGPAQFSCRVPSDDPRVNILFTDGEPFVEEGTRFIYGFRREDGLTEWVCRFAGTAQLLEDATRTEDGQTHIVAYDPWQYLFSRFCRLLAVRQGDLVYSPGLIGADGYPYEDAQPATILLQQLNILWSAPFYDTLSPDWTTFGLEIGTFETNLPTIDYDIQQGMSIGQLMTDLTAGGNCDITITPVYDPVAKPGILGALNLVRKAGSYKPTAVFAWDKPGRSLTGVSRLRDGTKRANSILYYGAQGGAPVPPSADTNSQAVYGLYEDEQFFPEVIQPKMYDWLNGLAAFGVSLRKDGAITVTVDPAPARSPRPFQDYNLGDWMPLLWSANLREESILVQRVVGIPIVLSDNGVEQIDQLLVIVSDTDQPEGFPGGMYLPGTAGVDPAIEVAGLASNARRIRGGTTAGFIRPFRRGT